jgi:hypothetical protein
VNRRLDKLSLTAGLLLVVMLLVTIVFGPGSALAKPTSENSTGSNAWAFGVMADTLWTSPTDPAAANINAVAVSIIKQVNQQFINKGVEFVVQVGDLTENGNDADIATRAAAARDLYKAGIGFFPMRGNHETYASPANGDGMSALRANFPQTQGTSKTFGAKYFSSPVLAGSYPDDLKGLAYSFDFGAAGNNARFVILDDWATPNKLDVQAGYPYGYSIADQQAWITARLNENTAGMAASVPLYPIEIGETAVNKHDNTIDTGEATAPGCCLSERSDYRIVQRVDGSWEVEYSKGEHKRIYDSLIDAAAEALTAAAMNPCPCSIRVIR